MTSKSELPCLFFKYLFALSVLVLIFSGCSLRRISKYKDIVYTPPKASLTLELNIFAPEKRINKNNVLVFIHGGNWNSGKKSQYSLIARNWAKKGVVAVIIDYPLSPDADYRQMASASAQSVKWVKENIGNYGGNPDHIFISGHSAGGHLAALISLDDTYFEQLGIKNPIKGAILIDAAGLDMYGYLLKEKQEKGHTYLNTFTSDPKVWKEATPFYHLHKNMPPMLIYRGGKTYDSILESNEKFIKELRKFAPDTPYQVQKGKKHIPMITQFFNPWNKRFDEIIRFMDTIGDHQDSSKSSSLSRVLH